MGITVEDIENHFVKRPVEKRDDLGSAMERDQQRMIGGLLRTALSRPLTDSETEELLVLYGVKAPTKEFALRVLEQGREE